MKKKRRPDRATFRPKSPIDELLFGFPQASLDGLRVSHLHLQIQFSFFFFQSRARDGTGETGSTGAWVVGVARHVLSISLSVEVEVEVEPGFFSATDGLRLTAQDASYKVDASFMVDAFFKVDASFKVNASFKMDASFKVDAIHLKGSNGCPEREFKFLKN